MGFSLTLVLAASACSHKSAEKIGEAPAAGNLPQFVLAANDIDVASPIQFTTNKFGTIQFNIKLSDAKRNELRGFSQQHLGQQVEILAESKVLVRPYIRSPISDGEFVLAFAASDTNLQAAVDWLNRK